MAYDDHIKRIYRRMGHALHRKTGLRLSATDVEELVHADDAVGCAMSIMCGREDVSEVEQLGPKSPAATRSEDT